MIRRRMLLVAYQCGPGMGSVSQIGWEWYSRLCSQHEVTLVTHVRNRPALAASGAPLAGSEIIYVDTEWFAGPVYRLARRMFPRSEHSVFLLSSLDYFVFDWCAYRQLRALKRQWAQRWEIIHRVTPVTLAAPTWLGRLGLPIVLGPLNSGLRDPRGFGTIMRQDATWLVRLRELARLFDRLIGSSRQAARILTASQATREGVPRTLRGRCRPMLENGVDLSRFVPAAWPEAPGPGRALRVLFVGRLVPVKALDLLLAALPQVRESGVDVELTVVGDGPMRAAWERDAAARGLAGCVNFVGNRSLDEVAAYMQRCHVFCLPSVRESGGAVLLEAMASARPVIAMNYGGPAELVDGTVGALIYLTTPQHVSDQIAARLREVVSEPGAWRARGHAGRRRVIARYTWPAKLAVAAQIYTEVLLQGVEE